MNTRKQQPLSPPDDSAPAAGRIAPAVILVAPQLGENIGTAARAMANFGLADLRIVDPRDGWPSEKAVAASSGAGFIIDKAQVFDTLGAAIADLSYVLATTARRRDMVKPVLTPETAAGEMATRIAAGERPGVLFGRERTGLENDEIALADAVVTAPVSQSFASLNLAQAVLLTGYEWHKRVSDGALGRETPVDRPAREGLNIDKTRPATKKELIGLFEHLEFELDKSGFLRPPEKRPAMARNIRNIFQRAGLTEQDIRTLRGIVASLSRRHERGKD